MLAFKQLAAAAHLQVGPGVSGQQPGQPAAQGTRPSSPLEPPQAAAAGVAVAAAGAAAAVVQPAQHSAGAAGQRPAGQAAQRPAKAALQPPAGQAAAQPRQSGPGEAQRPWVQQGQPANLPWSGLMDDVDLYGRSPVDLFAATQAEPALALAPPSAHTGMRWRGGLLLPGAQAQPERLPPWPEGEAEGGGEGVPSSGALQQGGWGAQWPPPRQGSERPAAAIAAAGAPSEAGKERAAVSPQGRKRGSPRRPLGARRHSAGSGSRSELPAPQQQQQLRPQSQQEEPAAQPPKRQRQSLPGPEAAAPPPASAQRTAPQLQNEHEGSGGPGAGHAGLQMYDTGSDDPYR